MTNTINFINKFESLVGSVSSTSDEQDFMHYFELNLAKSLIQDFDATSMKKLARIILDALPSN